MPACDRAFTAIAAEEISHGVFRAFCVPRRWPAGVPAWTAPSLLVVAEPFIYYVRMLEKYIGRFLLLLLQRSATFAYYLPRAPGAWAHKCKAASATTFIAPNPTSLVLRDYQNLTINNLLHPAQGLTSSLVVLPTGTGKTVIITEYLNRLLKPGERGLVIAHREELLLQARNTIERYAPSLLVELEQADSFASRVRDPADPLRRSVVLGSVQTLRGSRLHKWTNDTFSVVIIDEAHHAAAPGYKKIMLHFGCIELAGVNASEEMGEGARDRMSLDGSRESRNKTRLVGFTATPLRSDGIDLDTIFSETTVEYTIKSMIEGGHLVSPLNYQRQTSTDLQSVRTKKGDFDLAELEKAVNVKNRNDLIVGAYKAFAKDLPCVVFCAGVQHSHELAKLFNKNKVRAEAIFGDMGKEERAQALARYESGETHVLTNFAVLVEGWDAPKTQCIILARPTQSELLITQMVGRGLRKSDGKNYTIVIDLCDQRNKPGKASVLTSSLAGLPARFDPQGGDLFQLAEDLNLLPPKLQGRVKNRDGLVKTLEKFKRGELTGNEIDYAEILELFKAERSHELAWIPLSEDSWIIEAEQDCYEINRGAQGGYVLSHTPNYAFAQAPPAEVCTYDKKEDMFRLANSLITSKHPDVVNLLKSKAPWRSNSASQGQRDYLRRLMSGDADEFPARLTQGQASALIFLMKRDKLRESLEDVPAPVGPAASPSPATHAPRWRKKPSKEGG